LPSRWKAQQALCVPEAIWIVLSSKTQQLSFVVSKTVVPQQALVVETGSMTVRPQHCWLELLPNLWSSDLAVTDDATATSAKTKRRRTFIEAIC
jgi:hypothetical protein